MAADGMHAGKRPLDTYINTATLALYIHAVHQELVTVTFKVSHGIGTGTNTDSIT
jgi:hypothetical protein